MGLWCKDLPFVTVGRSAVPKPITLILPYYCNAEFFEFQIRHWRAFPPALREHFRVIVVDDGSPEKPASRVLNDIGWPNYLRLFRIVKDVRWNWLAARNRGAEKALEGWLLLTDMDHVLPVETLDALVHGVHRTDRVYAFSRREHTGQPVHPHSASFFMTRKMFWTIGGYDERASGVYGTDGIYRRRLMSHAKVEVLMDDLERHEHVGDSSTTRYLRKQKEDAQFLARFQKDLPPLTLTFAYEEVSP